MRYIVRIFVPGSYNTKEVVYEIKKTIRRMMVSDNQAVLEHHLKIVRDKVVKLSAYWPSITTPEGWILPDPDFLSSWWSYIYDLQVSYAADAITVSNTLKHKIYTEISFTELGINIAMKSGDIIVALDTHETALWRELKLAILFREIIQDSKLAVIKKDPIRLPGFLDVRLYKTEFPFLIFFGGFASWMGFIRNKECTMAPTIRLDENIYKKQYAEDLAQLTNTIKFLI